MSNLEPKTMAKKLSWKLRKYYRWYRLYQNRIRIIEREIGGEVRPC